MFRSLQFACALVVLGGVSTELFAAAALANGAATSAKPTSTNPVQRQIQMNADPDGISDFQFTMQYNPQQVTPVMLGTTGAYDIHGVNGYALGVRGTAANGYAINLEAGLVTVRGFYPFTDGAQVPSAEIDVFSVNFQLNQGLPLDTVLFFSCLGVPAASNPFGSDDFMVQGQFATDGTLQVTRRFSAADPANPILPSSSGPVAIVPEATGLAGLAAPIAFLAVRRRRAA